MEAKKKGEGEKTMKPEYIIRSRLQKMESALKDDEKIQHTHEYPNLKGQIEALKWVLEM